MGKSGGRRKKSGNSADQFSTTSASLPTASMQLNGLGGDPSVFLKRAHELKEEGNQRFQAKDYAGALEQYELALRLLPRGHPERAVFHSNRAACLLQMRPIDHEAVAAECSLALQAQPRYCRALLRRARALEALRRYDLALQDVNSLLALEPSHSDALDLARRLRVALSPSPSHHVEQSLASRPSPAALGASAVRAAAPIAGLGPCLPSRPVSKKPSSPPPLQKFAAEKERVSATISLPNGPQLKSESSSPSLPRLAVKADYENNLSSDAAAKSTVITRVRPLKLVYDHDIRLSEMPVNCSFKTLREIVAKRFPSSKSVLVKYKDLDGDLVTVTSTRELRLAESCAEEIGGKNLQKENGQVVKEKLQVLRLYVVEVSPEQEPSVPDEEVNNIEEEELVKGDENQSPSLVGDLPAEGVDDFAINNTSAKQVVKDNERKGCDHAECKEVDIDDWLYEFAQLFRQQVGIDPDAHLDLHELGMELCSEALEETITSKEAQALFEMSAAKFQEVAALAFFNWGNVHMCAARKRIPLDESLQKEAMDARLQEAYDWVKERYVLAGQKYEEALQVKPDFYEGLLALGQQHFETAKLHWSFALASKVDLTTWDSSETIKLFDSAEEKMKAATTMWEKAEEQRINELKDPSFNKKDELLKRKKKQGIVDGQGELSAEEAAEQATMMRSQIHLFWGNLLFERSQVEFKLGFGDWKKTLDGAVERFKLAGASEADISVVVKNHSSSGAIAENDDKKFISSNADNFKVPQKEEDKNELKN
ncbi:protein CLMP1 [Dendrobium catenatum]|uniref:Outer envelope protein 64, mitochondrial n=1 Tax=Dendrobium catenatum TaxID=906689 RepID=A0A2I0WT06_9ASPA|nr:protein CLMP1 [Dendrobium catenatum]PKU78783.1 Outer envelope protein 64, mitochondrial [Dendrobium catenatum]